MALWTSSYPVDTGDRDPSFAWPDADGGASLDNSNDMFAEFLAFEADGNGGLGADNHGSFMVEPHHLDGSASSEPSTADDFDFLTSSSGVAGQTLSATSYDVDPNTLNLFGGEIKQENPQADAAQTTVSDTELERLEGISLHSPKKTNSDPASPTPPNTVTANGNGRKSKKLVDALSSTIRKATTMRKTRKGANNQQDRPSSPTLDSPPKAMKRRAPRRVQTQHAPNAHMPASPPLQCDTKVSNFVTGGCDDPFSAEVSPTHVQPAMRYYSQGGLGTPIDSPSRKSESDGNGQHHWQHQQPQWAGSEFVFDSNTPWWTAVDNRNIDANFAMHTQHGELPYDYSQIQDASASSGLMIHMPQERPSQPGVVNDLTVNGQTYLPPPPPIPNGGCDRSSRPPKAPSAGARHRTVSTSPLRKQRAPSQSPTTGPHQSRHSSGGSISSVRSASGRLPGSMPGTPCSVRKRRSRDTGGALAGGSSSDDLTGGSFGGGGGGGGFVNFTPNDGTVLMTGVAPSGSSKTKARREKEAQDRRRRLSEAAMKAVAAAGGDIEQLKSQGFEF